MIGAVAARPALDPRQSWPAHLLATGLALAGLLALLDPAP